ncbi:MAG: carboxymuconolactone decarboxylase family protein [Candidatus Eisenbacteria bacterium]|nr:carboxymuconolactone decarboxylase family protein [Candidatus Latescibacterota bacterium]MBD3301945.1 carboxymuconolactone decarboxylase family protein [Candidatus Eisenbacteria bacterium]
MKEPDEPGDRPRSIEAFRREREALNEIVLENAGLEMKRFFSLDTQAYREGALPARTKEMLGLVASLVLRCDDCILYHLIRCRETEVSDEELREAMTIGLVVGGSITIPHIRRAMSRWLEMRGGGDAAPDPAP